MTTQHIAYRTCTPADRDLAVPLIISSGPETFNYIFADHAVRQTNAFVARSFSIGKSEVGHPTHTALLCNGKLVGVGALWDGSYNRRFTVSGLREIISFYGFRRGVNVIQRALHTERVIKPAEKDIAYIGHVGVSPSHRGIGLGTSLMRQLIAQAQEQGFKTCALDVSARNPKAQKLYEHLGFVVKRATKAQYQSRFGDVIEHRYMELDLKSK